MDYFVADDGPNETQAAALANALLGDVGQFGQDVGAVLCEPKPVVLADKFCRPGERSVFGSAHGGKESNLVGGGVGGDWVEWHETVCPPSLPACIPLTNSQVEVSSLSGGQEWGVAIEQPGGQLIDARGNKKPPDVGGLW